MRTNVYHARLSCRATDPSKIRQWVRQTVCQTEADAVAVGRNIARQGVFAKLTNRLGTCFVRPPGM